MAKFTNKLDHTSSLHQPMCMFYLLEVLILLTASFGSCIYEIRVSVYSLRNPTGRLAEGRCCDTAAGANECVMRNDRCDLQVFICQRPAGAMVIRGTLFNIALDCDKIDRVTTDEDDTLEIYFNDTFFNLENPLIFKGSHLSQNGIQLLAVVADDDSNKNDLVDRIPIVVTYQTNGTIPRRNYTGIFNLGTIEAGIEILCIEEFKGNCSACSPQCTCNFCDCPAGLTGGDCLTDINECEGITCSERGNCTDMLNSYQCECEPDYEGDQCERRKGFENYKLVIQLNSVNNSQHRLAKTNCTFCCDKDDGFCDLTVQYCIRPINSTSSDSTSSKIDTRCSKRKIYTSISYQDIGFVDFSQQNDQLYLTTITNLTDPTEGFQIYMEVLDEDSVATNEEEDDLIDRLVYNMVLEAGSSRVQNQFGMFGKATVSMEVRARCSSGFTGSFCDVPQPPIPPPNASTPNLSKSNVSRQQGVVIGTSLVATFVLIALLAAVIGITLFIKGTKRGGKLTVSLSTSTNINYSEMSTEYHELQYSHMYQGGVGNRYETSQLYKNGKEDVEYDYAEPDHRVITFRKESMQYNAIYWSPSSDVKELRTELKQLSLRKFCQEDLEIQNMIGSGEFSKVYKALWHDENGRDVMVAVKTTKEEATLEERIKFLQEAAIMGQFDHPYIISIFGVMVNPDKYHIIVELMAGGSLLHHLENIDASKQGRLELGSQLLCFSKQIANGMSYLELRGFIHRDLACRNILLNRHNICKIADFGLSRDLNEEGCYVSSGGKIPLKWTAPEAIMYREWSSASDVWSYGIVLFEIWSLGSRPYGNLPFVEFMKLLSAGNRLPPPPGCPRDIFKAMILCWHPNSESRPKFVEIVTILNRPEYILLKWSEEEEKSYSEEARQIGSSLPSGKNLYMNLQHHYIDNNEFVISTCAI